MSAVSRSGSAVTDRGCSTLPWRGYQNRRTLGRSPATRPGYCNVIQDAAWPPAAVHQQAQAQHIPAVIK